MNAVKDTLKGSQFMFLIIAIVQGSVLLISFIDSIANQDTWIIVFSSVVISIPFIISYIFLSKRFPGKSLIQINEIVYGPVLGKILSVFYILFFLLILALNFRDVVDFYNGYILSETPQMALLIVFALICAYTVKKGIRSIARLSAITVITGILVIGLTFVLLMGNMDLTNFLPVMEISGRTFIQSTHIFASVSFGEIVVLMMVMQKTSDDKKKLTKYALLGIGIAVIYVVLIVIRNTAVLGPSSSIDMESSYEAVRMINIGGFLSRVELLIALIIVTTLFIKICLFYYATVKSIAEILNLNSYSALIIPVGSIAIILATVGIDSVVFHNDYGFKYQQFVTLPFEFIFPPLSLLIAKIRRLKAVNVQA